MMARCQNIDAQKPAIMRRVGRAACGLAAATWIGTGTAMALDVGDIGSFYVGGKTLELKGLPKRELVLVPGSPPVTVDPNGEFPAGQMYVQYVKLTAPKARYPLL